MKNVRCRYCGKPSEDGSGVCDRCTRTVESQPAMPAHSAPKTGDWVAFDFPHGTGLVVVTNPPKSENEKFTGQVIASRTTAPGWENTAHLIAAAPDLREACARFIQFGKDGGDTSWHSAAAQPFFYAMMLAVGKSTKPAK